MKTALSKSEQIYRQLTRFYPASFRAEYSEAMVQHFRDQWRDASVKGSLWARFQFWGRIVSDIFVSSFTTRFEQTKGEKEFMKAKVPSFWFLWVALFLPLITGVVVFLFQAPVRYTAITRLEISKTPGPQTGGAYDPYFLQTQFEKIQSGVVLEPVVKELGLEKRLYQRGLRGPENSRPTLSGAVEALRRNLRVTQSRNTSLIAIRVDSEDRDEAAEVANRIAEVYRATVAPAVAVEVIDRAYPGPKPVSPNIPLIAILGTLMSGIMAAVGAGLLRAAFRGRLSKAPVAA